jgi:deoxyribodipyrimidine photolyase-related protein
MPTLRLILGDQLNPNHSWFQAQCPDVVYVLMEIRQETDYVLHHAQKILAIFAAMRDFAEHLKAQGHRVRYLKIDDGHNRQSLPENLQALIEHYGVDTFEYQAPDEYRLDRQLAEQGEAQSIEWRMVDSEHFYSARDEATRYFSGKKQWLMENFYRYMRTRHGVLLDGQKKPSGGQWNYDHDNRKRWPGMPREPEDLRPRHDHSALWQTVVEAGVKSFGQPCAESFAWPLNRQEALAQLEDFISGTLVHFGDFQDAMSADAWRLFHSQLSFAMNVKMLNPREVVNAAEAAYRAAEAPLAAVEGFIRQILGWREYVRGVYWSQMPGYDQLNALGNDQPLPSWFWDGNTRMRCMAHSIGSSLQHAHAHHIQRLMVIGNFALLAGLDPQQVHQWYLGVYIDAFEWVELPNTLGMSQFADGGLLATKPYVSGAAYIDRMSDYCKGCHYDKKLRIGERACPYNAMYWDFFRRNKSTLEGNHRLAMVYRNLGKMSEADLIALQDQSASFRDDLDSL